MKKYMVIIAIVGICLVFSVAGKETNPNGREYGEPVLGRYTPADVNSPKVQAVANIVLTNLQKEPACSDLTLLDVTQAKHKNETKKCKLTIGVTDDEIASIAARRTNGHHKQMTLNKPKPAPYIEGCRCEDLTNVDTKK